MATPYAPNGITLLLIDDQYLDSTIFTALHIRIIGYGITTQSMPFHVYFRGGDSTGDQIILD